MSSKLTPNQIADCIKTIIKSKVKTRKFNETIELQIGLKDYDTQKDKRFAGSVRLPNIPRPKLKICLIADAKHKAEALKLNLTDVDIVELDDLKIHNKEKKPIKAWAKKYSMLLATDTNIKKIPVVLGPWLKRLGMFPTPVTHNENLK